MDIISKISRGSRMDQVYIPKKRIGLPVGAYVLVTPLKAKKEDIAPYFYNIKDLDPIKISLIKEIFETISKNAECENIIVTGSFLEKGFRFNDIDILIIAQKKADNVPLEKLLESIFKVKVQIIILDSRTLLEGLSTDPLYKMMLSKFVSKNRVIFNVKRKINPQLLDLHLLKSKTLLDNFDCLTGNEKHYLTRNMVAISMFVNNKKIDAKIVDKKIKKTFSLNSINLIKNNMLDKNNFLKRYAIFYKETLNHIMELLNDTKQK